MSETFIAKIQKIRRVAIPIQVYEHLKLSEGQKVRVTIEYITADLP